MTSLSFLGACNDVGSSAILVDTGSEKILMDYGVKLKENPIEYPEEVKEKLNSILLTHSHLDHSGAVPYLFHNGQNCSVIGQEITRPFSRMLWFDSIKIAKLEGTKCRFNDTDVRRVLKKYQVVDYRKPVKIGKATVTSYDAGHIPGSAMFLLETNGKKILYTGDFNTDDTRLLSGCDRDIPSPDILITECTYGGKEHPDREKEERKFIEMIRGTLANDGVAVVACFAIARSQEALLILNDYGIKAPVYIDGMTQKATTIVNNYPHLQKDYNSVKNAMARMGVKFIEHPMQRRKVIKNPSIVITTSGMLSGGPVAYYLKKLHDREDCSLILTGFQVPDTEGDRLLKTGRYVHDDVDVKVDMNVRKFDFSAHASNSDLIDFVKKMNAEKVFCVHGDNTKGFAEELCSEGKNAIGPSRGESYSV
ncbi:MAG: MBL fold metallo-hydrolase [Candidatus Aenigmarchaeota archaeon]|nr:MBL fold metallo-hydrolase [Candidatus Aenigmarchaeota archaeon]